MGRPLRGSASSRPASPRTASARASQTDIVVLDGGGVDSIGEGIVDQTGPGAHRVRTDGMGNVKGCGNSAQGIGRDAVKQSDHGETTA